MPTQGATMLVMAETETTVVIVDDHDGFRRMARRLLESEGYQVVGEAADGRSALATIATLRPRLVVLDIQLPDIDGFEVARLVSRDHRETGIVLTSSRSATDYGTRIADSPARGFVAKADLSGPALSGLLGEDR